MLIGNRLRLARVEAGKTLRQTEEETGLSKDTISRIERGTREPQPLTVAKLAKAYGRTAEEFLEAPKAPSSSPEASEKVPVEERLVGYLQYQKRTAEYMRKQWEEAAEQNTFNYAEWNRAAELAIEMDQSFADTIPMEIYATGDKWLPQEEYAAVAELEGNISLLKTALERALRAYQSRFGEEGAPADVKDLAAIREQRVQEAQTKRHTNEQDHRAG